MIRFLRGLHDRVNDAVTGDTTIRAYDKDTGKLVETYKMKAKKDSDKDKDEE